MSFVQGAVRFLFVLLAIAAGAVFLFLLVPGYVTWEHGYLSEEFTFEHVVAGIYLMLFAPGVTPLIVSIYFFAYLRAPILNLIGLMAILPIVMIHFVVTIPASHSSAFGAFAIGCIELAVVVILLRLFHLFVVK